MPTEKNIFIVGADEHNARLLADLPDSDHMRFHPLLSYEETNRDEIDITDIVRTAEGRLDAFNGSIDAIVGFWDFPISTILPILRERVGLPGPSLEAVLKCEHKYWSRLEQQKVIDEIPGFGLVQLDDTSPPEWMRYPMWLKPVKSFASQLAIEVHDQDEFTAAMAVIREGIGRVGEPFEVLLDAVDLPREIAEAGGMACLAEESITGVMATVEGYQYEDEIRIYGIVDSILCPGSSSFLRYQYPSALPPEVCLRMAEITTKVIDALGLQRNTFNVEFFWDADTDTIKLLEVNPRHSQSHAELFEDVDGLANHAAMLRLGLGENPDPPRRQGRWAHSAKWFQRRFSDGFVSRQPSGDEIAQIERDIPGVTIELVASAGIRLSDMHGQDSYSYELANIYVGADTEEELESKFHRVVDALAWQVDDIDEIGG